MLNVRASWRVATMTNASPFEAGENGRPLRLVIDDETLGASPAAELLRALAHRNRAQIVSTSPGAPQTIAVAPNVNAHGAVEIEMRFREGGIRTGCYFAGNWPALVEQAAQDTGSPPSDVRRVLLLAHLTSQPGYDGFVSHHPLFARPRWRSIGVRGKTVTADEAVALAGLFLRAHGDWTVDQHGTSGTFLANEAFYRSAAIGLVPEYGVWLGAATAAWHESGDPTAFTLAEAIVERISRALRARDFLQVRLRHPDGDEAWEEVLFFFDSVLVSLSGALDSIATLAHHTYRLPSSAGFPSWRSRRRWIPELRKAAPQVAALVDDGRYSRAAVDILALLRNTIHGPALSGRLHDRTGRVGISDFMRTTLAFDGEEAAEIRAALEVLSSENVRWGSWSHDEHILLVHPGRFAEAAVAGATSVARHLLQSMDTARLSATDPAPPEGWIPDQRYRDNALLLIGLGSLDSTTLR